MEKPPKPPLLQETIGRIHALAREGKSPKKIRALTGVGITEIRRHTRDIEFGSENVGPQDVQNSGSNDSGAPLEETPTKNAVPGLGPARHGNVQVPEKQYVPLAQRKTVPVRFFLEALDIINKPVERIPNPAGGYQWPKPAEPKRKGRPSLPESALAAGKRYVPPARRETQEHEQIMKEHDLPTLKKVYFDLMDWKAPERVSEETKIPLKRIVQIIFNRKTQRTVFANYNKDIQKKYAMPNEELGLPKEPDIIAQNKALLYVVAARKNINDNPKYWEKNERRRPLA
ncbi:MAG: hypothetical protein WCX64_02515 [Candidatus Micrarchaeia archaeon]